MKDSIPSLLINVVLKKEEFTTSRGLIDQVKRAESAPFPRNPSSLPFAHILKISTKHLLLTTSTFLSQQNCHCQLDNLSFTEQGST